MNNVESGKRQNSAGWLIELKRIGGLFEWRLPFVSAKQRLMRQGVRYLSCAIPVDLTYWHFKFLFLRRKVNGYLENVTVKGVSGWAVNKEEAGEPVRVRVLVGKKVLTEAETHIPRPDVERVLSVGPGEYGFNVSVAIPSDKIGEVSAEAFDGAQWKRLKNTSSEVNSMLKKSRGYQSFDEKGASDSHGKLKKLRLSDITAGKDKDTPLKGKSVLDIGCNEGFFCIEAVRQGATRVLGIDYSQKFVDLAKARCPEAEFRKATWWEIPNEKFDVIFFLSAIHYEPEQKKLLTKLLDHLTPEGVLVLECGVAPGTGQGAWRTIIRGDGEKRYPYRDYLFNVLLSDYATRTLGSSVTQSGDPIPRMVFHCRPRKTTAVLVAALPYSGKTTLVRSIKNKGFDTYSTDMALNALITDQLLRKKNIATILHDEFGKNVPINLGKVGKYVADNNLASEFVDYIISEFPLEAETFFIEGAILVYEAVRTELTEKLKARGVRVWNMNLS